MDNRKGLKKSTHVGVLFLSIFFVITGRTLSDPSPSNTPIVYFIADHCLTLFIYSITISIFALISSLRNIKKYWFPVFAWVFLVAGLIDFCVGVLSEFFFEPTIKETIERIDPSLLPKH